METNISYAKKVSALKRANPKLDDITACKLLGITPDKLKQSRNTDTLFDDALENPLFDVFRKGAKK